MTTSTITTEPAKNTHAASHHGLDPSGAPHPRTASGLATRRHVAGVLLISIVAALWVLASELTQFIFGKSDFDKPLFLTYFCTSLFSVYLLGFARASWRAAFRNHGGAGTGGPQNDDYYRYSPLDSSNDHHNPLPNGLNRHAISDDVSVPVDDTCSHDAGHHDATALHRAPRSGRQMHPVNRQSMTRAVLSITPLFFLADYAFNWSLDRTSVASSSTISTTSSLFSLALGALFGAERFSMTKLFSAFLTVGGVALISGYDRRSIGSKGMTGDMVCVLAAFLYSLYTIALKIHFPSEDGAETTAMLFGFIGGLIMAVLWPVLIIFSILKWEVFELPSARVLGLLTLNSLIGTVLSDYLWALSVGLTTPVIATLALSLTMPFSLLFDYSFRSLKVTPAYIWGVLLVLTGFFAANLDEAWSRRGENDLDE